jgi:hypothetical protein
MKMKYGTRIEVLGWDLWMNETWERATIARTTRKMTSLPDGYRPVCFDDGGVLLCRSDRIRVTDNSAGAER